MVLLLLLGLISTALATPIWIHNATERVTDVALSGDAGTIALSDDRLRVLDRSGTERTSTWSVNAIAVSKDGNRVVIGGAEGVQLLDRNGTELWSRGPGPATSVACSGDGKVIAAGTGQGVLQVFNATGGLVGSAVLDKKVQGSVIGVAIDTSGSTIAVADEKASYIYTRAGKFLGRNERWTPLSVAIAGNGTIAAIGQAGGIAFLRANGTLQKEVRTGTRVTSVAISRGGDLVGSGDEAGMLAMYGTNGTQLWNLTLSGRVAGIGVSENATRTAAAWTDRSLRVLDANGTALLKEELSGIPTAVALSADGRYLVVGCQDGATALFATTGKPAATTVPASPHTTKSPSVAGNATTRSNTTEVNRTLTTPSASLSSTLANSTMMTGANLSSRVPATTITLEVATLETLPKQAGVMPFSACVITIGALFIVGRRRNR